MAIKCHPRGRHCPSQHRNMLWPMSSFARHAHRATRDQRDAIADLKHTGQTLILRALAGGIKEFRGGPPVGAAIRSSACSRWTVGQGAFTACNRPSWCLAAQPGGPGRQVWPSAFGAGQPGPVICQFELGGGIAKTDDAIKNFRCAWRQPTFILRGALQNRVRFPQITHHRRAAAQQKELPSHDRRNAHLPASSGKCPSHRRPLP